MSRWSPGDAIVLREVVDGYVQSVVPVRVWRDDEILALYRAGGTTCLWPSHPKGERRPPWRVTLRPRQWNDDDDGMLTLIQPDERHTVAVLWGGGWRFRSWYVDFVEPHRRTPIGFDFADLALDLVVPADGHAVVKDEAEFDQLVASGAIDASTAAAVRSACEEVRAAADSRSGVFAEPWTDWRPPPAWNVPALTDQICDRAARAPLPADEELSRDAWVS